MSDPAGYATDLIDVSGLTLEDLADVPDSALSAALRVVLGGEGGGTSAGFSSSLRHGGSGSAMRGRPIQTVTEADPGTGTAAIRG